MPAAVTLTLVALAVVAPTRFGRLASQVEGFVTTYFGWLHILGTSFSWFSCWC